MKQPKKPLYVEVYETLYKLIESKEYLPGQKIPGEIELSKQLNVSRSTLRQALLIMKENGLIYNIQGSGNYVSFNQEEAPVGLEKLVPLIPTFSTKEVQGELMNVQFDVPSSYNSKKLGLGDSSVVMMCHKLYQQNKTNIGYSFFTIPVGVLADHDVNIQDHSQISTFVDGDLYEFAAKSHASIVFSEVGEFLSDLLHRPVHQECIMIEEVFYDATGLSLAIVRQYILPEFFQLVLSRTAI